MSDFKTTPLEEDIKVWFNGGGGSGAFVVFPKGKTPKECLDRLEVAMEDMARCMFDADYYLECMKETEEE